MLIAWSAAVSFLILSITGCAHQPPAPVVIEAPEHTMETYCYSESYADGGAPIGCYFNEPDKLRDGITIEHPKGLVTYYWNTKTRRLELEAPAFHSAGGRTK